MKFSIAESLILPADAVTQTFGFFGRKGSGKTYAAGVLAEEFLIRKVQIVVLDPVGNWFGLRLSRNGIDPSPWSIPILGGERGDIPLQNTAGALVAQTIIETGTSAVLDVSLFRKAERKRFMADFAEELFHKKKTSRSPLHLFIEEAQLFAPQLAKGEERMLGAIEDLVRLGRNYGIGCSMVSQRPQSINTEVRNQCEPLIVFQLVAKHERDAIGDWMEHMGVGEDLKSLSTLKTGECFFWSPAWMQKFLRLKLREKISFDASSTPTAGNQQRPGKLKQLDLGQLQQAMAAQIEEAKTNDPAHLRQQLAKARQEIKRLEAAGSQVQERVVEKSVLSETDKQELADARKLLAQVDEQLSKVKFVMDGLHATISRESVAPSAPRSQVPVHTDLKPAGNVQRRAQVNNGALPEGEHRMLTAIVQLKDPTRTELSLVTGYATSTRNAYLQRLFGKGLVTFRGDCVLPLPGSSEAIGDYQPLPTGDALREHWYHKLPEGESRVLQVVCSRYPEVVSREDISQETNYAVSTRNAYLQRLSARRLVTCDATGVRASDKLFD